MNIYALNIKHSSGLLVVLKSSVALTKFNRKYLLHALENNCDRDALLCFVRSREYNQINEPASSKIKIEECP